MATKSRRLKTPIQLWVGDSRRAGGYSSKDLAEWTGVTIDTARGWESRGRPSEDAIRELERRFGSTAPDMDTPPVDQGALVAAIEKQTEAIGELVALLRPMAEAQALQVADLQRAVQRLFALVTPEGPGLPARPEIVE